ncbi:hypothetical protein IFM89_015007 [Coptis chinensis]|uniref:JmjC domain-containing protein n=1 Tax=Coptis chinensis TaxID=261450 RepID=A0A835HMF7_9MAGN|nr:hypothetical protein IFM89_015007 [Coptis chinensis]
MYLKKHLVLVGNQWSCGGLSERGSKGKLKEEARSVKAIDCLDWLLRRPYQWPEMLKLKDWPSSSSFEDRLPRYGVEFTVAFPFSDYTHPKFGILYTATKLPEILWKPDLGTKNIVYWFPEELGRGDSITKLHCDMSDVVYFSYSKNFSCA